MTMMMMQKKQNEVVTISAGILRTWHFGRQEGPDLPCHNSEPRLSVYTGLHVMHVAI